MRLIIIGNGFDLAHGLPTSFNDFKKYLATKSENKKLIDIVNKMFQNNGYVVDKEYNWNEIEELIYKEYSRLSIDAERKKLVPFIDEFSHEFHLYLEKIVLPKMDGITLNKSIRDVFDENKDMVILNFNYTNLYKKYLNGKKPAVFDIHGDIDNKENSNIVIGYFCDDSIYNSNSQDFEVRYKGKHVCKSTHNFKNRGKDLSNEIFQFSVKHSKSIDDIVVIGYSFGKSDNHIYPIIKSLLVQKLTDRRIPYSQYLITKKIKVSIFEYNGDGVEKWRLLESALNEIDVRTKVIVNGIPSNYNGEEKSLFEVEYLEYENEKTTLVVS